MAHVGTHERAGASTDDAFAAYALLGAIAVVGALSLGWLVLAPVLVLALLLRFTVRRRGAIGMAAGAGMMLLVFGLPALDRAYGPRLVVMGVSLLCAGLTEQARRTWVAPR
jgi:hypothetical protein